MQKEMDTWANIRGIYVYIINNERYVTGFAHDDGRYIDLLTATANLKLQDLGFIVLNYKNNTPYIMPTYKKEIIINTNIRTFMWNEREANKALKYISHVVSVVKNKYNAEQLKSTSSYEKAYNRLLKTGIVNITLEKPKYTETEEGARSSEEASKKLYEIQMMSSEEVLQKINNKVEETKSKMRELNIWDEPITTSDIAGSESIIRPFDGDAINLDNYTEGDHLIIPRDTKARFNLAVALFNGTSTKMGLPLSYKRVTEMYEEHRSKLKIIDNRLKKAFGVDFIDYTGRKATATNIGALFCKISGKYVQKSNHITNGKVSFTLEDARRYEKMFKSLLDTELSTDEYDNVNMLLDIATDIVSHKEWTARWRQLKDFNDIVNGVYSTTYTPNDIWATRDEKDPDIWWVHPHIRLAETNRFQCYSPNPQGKTSLVKSCITAPEGYTILSLDISAQDVYVLVWGVMKDAGMKEKVLEFGDPYKALLDYCGYEPTTQNKKILKRPLLSRMNGKSVTTIVSEMENRDYAPMVVDSLRKIESEDGYNEIVLNAKKESFSEYPIRKGLFGTENYIDLSSCTVNNRVDHGSIQRKILNANFQMTSAEILCISYICMMHDLLNDRIKGVTFEDFCPLIPIHDEIVAICKNEIVEKAKKILTYYILPSVENWGRMSGEITYGKSYQHK